MKRSLLVALALTVVGAACSSTGDVAASVNGTDITVDDVNELVYGESVLDDTEFTQLLGVVVQWNVIADAAEADFGIVASEDEIATQADELFAQQGAGQTFEEFLETQNVSESGLDQYAEQVVINNAVIEEIESGVEPPSTAEAEQLLADDPASWTEVCAAHILVATLEEAEDVLAQLDAGADFATLAQEVSIDTGSGAAGGDLGCASPSGYVEEFAAATLTAPIGEVTDPVQTQFGFHMIRVDSRTEATTEELTAVLAQNGLADALQSWLESTMESAEVEVSEEWGTWEGGPAARIVPPGE